MVQTTFPKHAAFRSLRYPPTGLATFTPTTTTGEQCALYVPEDPTDHDPLLIHIELTGLATSTGTFADVTNQSITSAQGIVWQALMRHCKVLWVQVAATQNGASYTGEGYFEPPGGAGGWESISVNDCMSDKDVAYAVSYARYRCRDFGINKNAIALQGSSGGSIVSHRTAFGQNMANQWGAGGQHDESTRPNCIITQHTVPVSLKPFDQAATSNALANHFESVATPASPADAFNDVAAASLRAYELTNWCPFWHTKDGPPTFLQGDVTHVSVLFGEPYPAGVIAVNQGHSMWGAIAMKCRKPGTQVYLADAISKSSLSLGVHYDGVMDDIDAAGVAGNANGTAIDWLMENIHTPEYKRSKDESWIYTGDVLTTGRYAIPVNRDRSIRTLRVTCTHAVNALRLGPTQDQALQYVYPTGIPVEIRTSGPLWIKSDAATASSYMVEEYD